MAQPLLQGAVLLFKLIDIERPVNDHFEFLDLDRLTEEIVRPLTDRCQCIVAFCAARNHNHFRARVLLEDSTQRL